MTVPQKVDVKSTQSTLSDPFELTADLQMPDSNVSN